MRLARQLGQKKVADADVLSLVVLLQRAYIILYLAMAVLSLTTVVLSLLGDCPPTSFYVLEVIVNTVMIAEVGIRMIAYGSVRPSRRCPLRARAGFADLALLPLPSLQSFFTTVANLLDLLVTTFCIITLIVVFSRPCSRGEEVLDSAVLVVRNLLQFSRLATLLRRSV